MQGPHPHRLNPVIGGISGYACVDLADEDLQKGKLWLAIKAHSACTYNATLRPTDWISQLAGDECLENPFTVRIQVPRDLK
jgi:hypothetical protein